MRRGLMSCFQFLWNILPPSSGPEDLLRIEFDDQLLLDRLRDVRSRGKGPDDALEVVPVELQPGRNALPHDRVQRLVDADHLPALFTDLDLLAGPDEERGNVDLAPRDDEVPVPHHLPALPSRHRKTELVDDVVQPPLEKDQEVVAG